MKIVDVSMWKMESCIEGNVVNNLVVLLLYTELSLFSQKGFEVCSQFLRHATALVALITVGGVHYWLSVSFIS